MAKFVVQSVQAKEPFNTQNGTLYPFNLMGLLDGQLDSVQMNFKKAENCPKIGEEIEGTVETTQYGKKFKKTPSTQGFGGNAGGRHNDPEVQNAIIRQNALTNAVAYVTAKANLMSKAEGEKYMTGKEVLEVANTFASFSAGKINVTKKSEPVTPAMANEVFPEYTEENIEEQLPF